MHRILQGGNIQGEKPQRAKKFRAKSKNPLTKEGLVPKVQWKLYQGHDTLNFEQESNPMNLELENKSTYKNNTKKNTKNVYPKSN